MEKQSIMKDKLVLITGGTGGIGKQTALALAKLGAHVIVTGRSQESGEAAASALQQLSDNPQIGDGLSSLGKAVEMMAKQGITMKLDKIHMLLGEGNFVLAVSEGAFAGQPTCFYDMFRVENSKVAEHWDTIETIPPKQEWKNDNGKFNF